MVLLVAALVLALMPRVATAQDADSGSGYKIGVVQMGVLLKDYNKRKEMYDDLEKTVAKLSAKPDEMQKTIEADKKKYEEEGATMSPEEREELKDRIEAAAREYRFELEKRQKEIDNEEEEVLKTVIEDITNAIAEIAVAKNYHIVLNATNDPRAGVVYYSESVNITPAVLAKLNSPK